MYNRDLSPRPGKIHIIDHPDKVGQAVEHLLKFDLLGYDTETYNKFDRNVPAFNPYEGARMRLAQFTTPEADAYVFDLYKVDPRSFMYYMFPNRYTCVIQNSKFEIKFLQHQLGIYKFGPMFDTMLAEQVLARGRVTFSDVGYIPVGLDSIAKRRLKIDLPKDEQKGDWYKESLTEDQIVYAAMDSTVVLPIFQHQSEALIEQRQVRVAELEFNAVPAYAWMENNGFTMDTKAWLTLAEHHATELDRIKKRLWQLLGTQNTLWDDMPTMNINSRDLVEQGLNRLGIELPINDEGEITLSNKLLSQLHEKGKYEAVDLYIEHVKIAKRLSSFGPSWVKKYVNKYTGRIHCNLKQIGADTGRSAASSPNLMQIPKENEFRNCFTARDGWVLIDADYSQCELRILAEMCRDKNLLNAFDKKIDLHYYTGYQLFHEINLDVSQETMTVVSKEERGTAKNMNFLIVYGGGAFKLAWNAQIPIERAEEIVDLYLTKVYPGAGQWLDRQGRNILYNGLEARTMTNRCRKYIGDLNDKKFKSALQRHAKNMPIQGTNADITKLALTQIYNEIVDRGYTDNIKMILPVHDEVVSESQPEYALEGEDIMRRQMLDAEGQYFKRVDCVVDSDITLKWYKDVPIEAKEEAEKLIPFYPR